MINVVIDSKELFGKVFGVEFRVIVYMPVLLI
jgi:hypothetical protein